MVVFQVLLLTVLFGSTVVSRHHQLKHRQEKPHFRSVLPNILQNVDDLDELTGNIEQPLIEEETQKNDATEDNKLQEFTGIDIDKPLRDHEIENSLRPQEVIQNLSNTFGHKYLECEAMYHYPQKLRLNFLNFWNGDAITDRMAGCALLCIGQKLRMMDEIGNMRVTEAMELLKANEADEKTTQGVVFLMAQCRGIIDDQQLSKDVCAAGLLYSICFRDGIKALGWTPITSTDISRKHLQDARDWLLAHLGTSNTTETISTDTQSHKFLSIYNSTTNINKTNIKHNGIAERYENVTNSGSGYEYTTAQTLTDSLKNKIHFTNEVITDTASANFYNVTNTNNPVNTLVSKTIDLSNSFLIKDIISRPEITAPVAVEGATPKRNLMVTPPQNKNVTNSPKTILKKNINKYNGSQSGNRN